MKKAVKKNSITADSLKKIPLLLANHAFLIIFLCILLDMAFGGLLYYQYIFLAPSQQSQLSSSAVTFKQSAYQDVIAQWQTQNQPPQTSTSQSYTIPFANAPIANSQSSSP